jgi:diguanylate cyclase (GGDEF)-like protein/PAS domain S-box-containing protein
MSKKHVIYSLPMILLLTVAIAGWFATDYLGKNAQQEIIGESQTSALTLSIYLSSTFTHIEGAVKSLAGSPWIAPALMSRRDQNIEHANSALDRYNSAMNTSISYLMDADGTTVASSNRDDPDSFVGKSYRFRPYFQEAAKGQAGRYFALGITSGKRGFYASYPVQNRLGKVLGVVTMKKDLDEIETFFSKYPFCFLVSPEGIIFLSSQPVMALKSLWPLDKAAQEKLIASQQFGNKVSETVFLKKEIADGTEVTLEGNDYLVSRKVLDSNGWWIVLLTPLHLVKIYKLIGILSTISVCFLIMVFSGIIYVADRSREAIRRSEESKRLLLHAAGEGIFGVNTTGQVTFINPAALRMLGFAEEEVLGENAHSLMHHSHEDGSNYPMEDCPMYASYIMATESSVLWRKDGGSFPVEYSSMPIIRDDKVTGAVVTFKDITERKRSEDVLKESEEKQRLLFDNAMSAIAVHEIVLDAAGQPVDYVFLSANPAFETHTGLRVAEILGRRVTEVLPDIEKAPFIEIYGKVVLTGKPISFQQYSEPLGRYYAINAYRLRAGRFAAVFTDITEREKTEEALRESEARMRTITDSALDAILMMDPDGHTSYWNPAAERIFGYTGDEAIGKNLHQLIVPQRYHEAHHAAFDIFKRTGQGNAINSTIELEACHKNGHEISVELSLSAFRLKNGWHTLGIIRDITERKLTEEKILQMAYYDSLTGLPNRKLFSDRLHITLAQAQRNQKIVGVAMLDLDNFKGVNDTLGHDVGDVLLKATAERLNAALRKGDTVARFGGDEFVLILPDLKVIEDATQVAQKIVDSFCKPFLIDTHELVVTTSIGIAIYPDNGTDEGMLLKNADIAMYQAKQAGRARYQLYNEA